MRHAFFLLTLGLCSCSASAAAPRATGDAGAAGDSAASCNTPLDQRPDGGTCVLEAKGTVADLAGAPLVDLIMTLCGSQCYGARSGAGGAFDISPVGDFLDTENYAIHADGRPDHAVDYLRLTKGEPQVISVTMRLPTLPPSSVLLPPDLAPASSITQNDLTLTIPEGTFFDLDVEDFGTTAGRTLRVASVPLSSAPPYALAANVDAIYALAPSGAKAKLMDASGALLKMGVALKNSAGLPAMAAVDLLVLGDDYFSTPPSVGLLSVAAAAHVSTDGSTIQTDPGEGISELTWLGVRRKGK